MTTVAEAFGHARTVAGSHMAASEAAKLFWGETAITEMLLAHTAPAVTVVPFTQPAEARSGADWVWWWIDGSAAYGMLTQAKRVVIRGSQIWDPADDETPFATSYTAAAQFAPSVGDEVAFRSPSVGGPNARTIPVRHVAPLATFDGFSVSYLLPDLDFREDREFREELVSLGWKVHPPERRLDPLADADDYGDA